MLKKRIIFSLLFSEGYFNLSRNFRLQRIGDMNWLLNNYDFSNVSRSIDELIVLDVTKGSRNSHLFLDAVKKISEGSKSIVLYKKSIPVPSLSIEFITNSPIFFSASSLMNSGA